MKSGYAIVYSILRMFFTPLFPMRYIGRENIPEGAAIVCANHTSSVDPLLVAFALKMNQYPHFMAKIELYKVPLLGRILKAIGVFFVDRGKSDVGAIRASMQYLKAGEKIMMFPEGTRVSEDDAIAAKTGAVRLAVRLGVPILPIYVPRKKRLFRGSNVIIGKPYCIEPMEKPDYQALSDELLLRIKELS